VCCQGGEVAGELGRVSVERHPSENHFSHSYDLGLATNQEGVRCFDGGKGRVREKRCVDQRASIVDDVLAFQWRAKKNCCCTVSLDGSRYLIHQRTSIASQCLAESMQSY
jgi:hypothetical protein